MGDIISGTIISQQAKILAVLSGGNFGKCKNVSMAKVTPRQKSGPPRHFIREWRKHRNLTMEQLAEIIGVTQGAISQLERGQTNYTQPMLEALADALHCRPYDLIMRTPEEAAADDWLAHFFRNRNIDELKRIKQMLNAAFPEDEEKTGT